MRPATGKMSALNKYLILLLCASLASCAMAGERGKTAVTQPADPRCSLRGETGMCRAYIESWFYDPGGNQCRKFVWGGCGEPKPFSSEDECRRICGKPDQ